MLLRVGIDPDTGIELEIGLRGPGKAFVRRLREQCVLVIDSPEAKRSILEAFAGCGSSELAQIIATLVSSKSRCVEADSDSHRPVPLDRVETAADLGSWRRTADLLILAEHRAERLDDHFGTLRPEFASFRDAANTGVVDNLDSQWRRSGRVGDSRERLWDDVFAPLAGRSERVYLVDGYIAHNLDNELVSQHRSRRDHVPRGAEWFLRKLAQSGARRVMVAADAAPFRERGVAIEPVRERLLDWLRSVGGETVWDLQLTQRTFDHGRRIAFEGWAGIEVHQGTASFDKERLTEPMQLFADRRFADDVRKEYLALTR